MKLQPIAQMWHVLIVNTTQKSVDRAVEQRIYARLTDAIDFEDVPSLPKWIQRVVESGDVEQALRIVDHLNREKDSPWWNKIQTANDDSKAGKTGWDGIEPPTPGVSDPPPSPDSDE